MIAGGDMARERKTGLVCIAISAPVAIGLWLAIDRLAPTLSGMDTLAERMLFTLKCGVVAVLFCLVAGIEAVAHERLTSPAFDPLAGFQTSRLRVNLRYLQNTLEQLVVFLIGLFGLAAYCPDGSRMRAVLATAIVWILARMAFWIGYHKSAAMRGLGIPGLALGMIVLLYVMARFGYDLAGLAGAIAPLALFLAFEAFLFWATRPGQPQVLHADGGEVSPPAAGE
ncbi:MAG TPA: MAPEG family protein [Caulobacteraceae bacterium]